MKRHITFSNKILITNIKSHYFYLMKGIVAILASFVMLITALSEVMTILQFHLSQTYIVENFCVNIDNPEAMCQGACYLGILLSKDFDRNLTYQSFSPQGKFYYPGLKFFDFPDFLKSIIIFRPFFKQTFYDNPLGLDIFHPPSGSLATV